MQVVIGHGVDKGLVKRGPREEMALRVRMLDGKHLQDVYQKLLDELGDRAKTMGPLDISRNALRSWVLRVGTAYRTSPLVEGLSPEFASLIGDMTARTLQERYSAAGGRPMPTRMDVVSEQVLHYRLACNWCGTLIGWADRSQRPFAQVITPDDLEVDYRSEDPLSPTVIRHFRTRWVGKQQRAVTDTYDLTDLDAPSFRVMVGEDDITEEALGVTYEGDRYWWRYADGRPFHRIVISGDPRMAYRGLELVEGTLRLAVGYSYWWAGMRDAGHPRTHAIGLTTYGGSDSDSETGATGIAAGPEHVISWQHSDRERPGSIVQLGPGFDPEVVGKALRTYEVTLLDRGLPVSYEQTGGEPTESERRALGEVIAETYADCREHDGIVLKRMAAVHNRASSMTEGMQPANLPEAMLPVLYREEVDASLENPTGATGGAEKVQDTALNGAQVQAAQSIVEAVASGQLPRDTGIAMLVEFFNIESAQADRLMGTVGGSFEPAALPGAVIPEPTEETPDE